MIKTLRNEEEVILYKNILESNDLENEQIIAFLKNEFISETLDYPFKAPIFNKNAAFWAAKVVYISAQLILFRQNREQDLELLLPKLDIEINASTMLSVDLCFRFIPDMLKQLQIIDSEDALIPILEKLLVTWHYSGVNYTLPLENLLLDTVTENKCLQQLYIDRIIQYRNKKLAKNQLFYSMIKANLGIFENEYWSNFKLINTDE